VPFEGDVHFVFESGNGSVDFNLDRFSSNSDSFIHVGNEEGDLCINVNLDSLSLVFDGKFIPGIEVLDGDVIFKINIKFVCGNFNFQIVGESLDEDLVISVPLESVYLDQIFVFKGNISVLGVVEVNDDFSLVLEFVIPEDLEVTNLHFKFMKDGSFSSDKEVVVVKFNLINGNLSFNDNLVLVFHEDSSLLFFSFGNDLNSISFNDSDTISSQEFDLSVNISVDFNSNLKDFLVTCGSELKGKLLDVVVDFLSDLGDLNISPGPEVGSFSVNMSHDSDLDCFNLKSGFFFKSNNSNGSLLVD